MSKIEVNAIEPQTGTTLTVGASGDTVSLPTNVTLKTDTIQNTNSSTLITQTNATTITLGYSGATITINSNATQSGIGRQGAVTWDTTAKTTTVTAVSGTGYFINTTSGSVTVNLPAGVAGSIVALSDYAGTWNTNAVTLNANGSEKIGGVAAPASLNTRGQAVTFVYVDSTRGWINTGDATYVTGNPFIVATGGTITTSGCYKVHTFNSSGCFVVTNAGAPTGSNTVEYLVVAGGGGGSGGFCQGASGGAGGAGGFRTNYPVPATTGIPVTATTYPITVGGGGSGSPNGARSGSGSNSVFSTITSTGGGGGGSWNNINCAPALTGGSGGGGGGQGMSGASGNSPPTTPSQGNPGGNGGGAAGPPGSSGGGGGGASASGSPTPGARTGGAGGAGTANSISGSSVTYAGGGGGGGASTGGSGGSGGGGPGGSGIGNGTAGTSNTGGGGGAGSNPGTSTPTPTTSGANGGSGIVIIRYKYQ